MSLFCGVEEECWGQRKHLVWRTNLVVVTDQKRVLLIPNGKKAILSDSVEYAKQQLILKMHFVWWEFIKDELQTPLSIL